MFALSVAVSLLVARSFGALNGEYKEVGQSLTYSAKNNGFASFTLNKELVVSGVEFDYVSGPGISCGSGWAPVYWGCNFPGTQDWMCLYITDEANNVVYPGNLISKQADNVFSGYDILNQGTLTTKDAKLKVGFKSQYTFKPGKYRVWFGEDLFDKAETDNTGSVTFNLFFKIPFQKSANYALLVSDGRSYKSANEQCNHLFGTQLATICTSEDNAEIVKLIGQHSNGNVWIGFNDQKSDGTFQWNSGNVCSYTNWKVGEPYKKRFVTGNANNEDCAYIHKDGYGQWRTYDCDSNAQVLCDLRTDHASAHEKVADLAKVVNSLSDKYTKLEKYVRDLVTRVRTAIGIELQTDDDLEFMNENNNDNSDENNDNNNNGYNNNYNYENNDENMDSYANENNNDNNDKDDYKYNDYAYDYDYAYDNEYNDENYDYNYNYDNNYNYYKYQ